MFKIFKKKLSYTFTVFLGFQIILIIVVLTLVFFLYQNQENLAKSRDTHFNSYLLADELRQSSDDLTRFARAYVQTENPKFEDYYWTILDIRNGKLPRPLDYQDIYWDFRVVNGEKPRGDGEATSLHDLMVKEGFTKDELAKLSLAQKNSDDLVKTEMIAMNATKGLFADVNGAFTVKGTPDHVLANKLMNDDHYYQMKSEIMRPIDDFYKMFERRTAEAVNKYLKIATNLYLTLIILVSFILFISIYSFILIKRQILERETSEEQLAKLSSDLEKRVKERTLELEQSEAIIRKTLTDAERVNKLMVGRELEMIKLKKEIASLKNPK